MNSTIAVDEAILISNETPNAASIPLEAYTVETTTVDEIREAADGLTHLTGGIN